MLKVMPLNLQTLTRFLLIALCALIGFSSIQAHAEGDLARRVTRLPALVFGDGEENDFMVSGSDITISTGQYYMLPVEAKGYKEYRFEAPEFFANLWVNQVVVNDLEVHARQITALEFDDQGTMELWFIALRPGTFAWRIEGLESKGMSGEIVVK